MKQLILLISLLSSLSATAVEIITGQEAETLFVKMEGNIAYPVCNLEQLMPEQISLRMLLRKHGTGASSNTNCFYVPDFTNNTWNFDPSGKAIYQFVCYRTAVSYK